MGGPQLSSPAMLTAWCDLIFALRPRDSLYRPVGKTSTRLCFFILSSFLHLSALCADIFLLLPGWFDWEVCSLTLRRKWCSVAVFPFSLIWPSGGRMAYKAQTLGFEKARCCRETLPSGNNHTAGWDGTHTHTLGATLTIRRRKIPLIYWGTLNWGNKALHNRYLQWDYGIKWSAFYKALF